MLTCSRSQRKWPTPDFRLPSQKYAKMLLSLGDGNRKVAADIFREVLMAEEEMYVARMKIVGVLQEKINYAPYIKIADGTVRS